MKLTAVCLALVLGLVGCAGEVEEEEGAPPASVVPSVSTDEVKPQGGGWPGGTFNPCPYGQTYSCTTYGYCTCW